VLSGAMHYFRVPRASWEDRLYKLKAMGLNTVETYNELVIFELHEPGTCTVEFREQPHLA
jgi:beta-galactosidase